MKTIRLLYPDHLSGGLDTYYFGANLLAHILPANESQPLLRVEIAPPDGKERTVKDGIRAREEVTEGIRRAAQVIEAPSRTRLSPLAETASCLKLPLTICTGATAMWASSGSTPIRMFPRRRTDTPMLTLWCWGP